MRASVESTALAASTLAEANAEVRRKRRRERRIRPA
jgi:hypothetical protein